MKFHPPASLLALARRVALLLAFSAALGWLVAQWRMSDPYHRLNVARVAAFAGHPTAWALHLEEGAMPLMAVAQEPGALVVWAEREGRWQETWRGAFSARRRVVYDRTFTRRPAPAGLMNAVRHYLRGLTDPDSVRVRAVLRSDRNMFKPGLLFADLNQDGVQDLVVVDEHLSLLQGEANGTFALRHEGREVYELSPPQLTFQDVTGDSRPELIVTCLVDKASMLPGAVDQSVMIYEVETGVAGWTPRLLAQTVLTDPGGYQSIRGPTVADFEGTGRVQMVFSNSNGYLWALHMKEGRLVSGPVWKVPSGGAVSGATAAGDMDGDGRPELLIGTNGGSIFTAEVSHGGHIMVTGTGSAGRLVRRPLVLPNRFGPAEMVVSRGQAGYAGMRAEDVVVESWKRNKAHFRLEPQWKAPVRKAGLLYRVNLDGGAEEVLNFSGHEGMEVIRR